MYVSYVSIYVNIIPQYITTIPGALDWKAAHSESLSGTCEVCQPLHQKKIYPNMSMSMWHRSFVSCEWKREKNLLICHQERSQKHLSTIIGHYFPHSLYPLLPFFSLLIWFVSSFLSSAYVYITALWNQIIAHPFRENLVPDSKAWTRMRSRDGRVEMLHI